MMGDLASEVVRRIVDYLRKRDVERAWDGGAFGMAANEIEGLGSLWGDLATSRTQTLTDTPDPRNTMHDTDAVFALAESAIRQHDANLEWLRQVRLAQVAAVKGGLPTCTCEHGTVEDFDPEVHGFDPYCEIHGILTDTPPAQDLRAVTGNVLGCLAEQGRAGLRAIEAGDALLGAQTLTGTVTVSTVWPLAIELRKLVMQHVPDLHHGEEHPAEWEALARAVLVRVAAHAPVEDGGQRSREAAESTGIEGGSLHNTPPDPNVRVLHGPWRLGKDLYRLQLGVDDQPEFAWLNEHTQRWVSDDPLDAPSMLADWVAPEFARVVEQQNAPVRDQIQALNEEIVYLRDRERDVEHGVVAEIVGWLRHVHLDVPNDVYGYAQIGDVNRAAEILAEFVAGRIERGDWRAQPQPQPAEPDAR